MNKSAGGGSSIFGDISVEFSVLQTQYCHTLQIPREANQRPLAGDFLQATQRKLGKDHPDDYLPAPPRSAARFKLPRMPLNILAGESDQSPPPKSLPPAPERPINIELDLLLVIRSLRDDRGNHPHRRGIGRRVCIIRLF
jgi:hypothetical protein